MNKATIDGHWGKEQALTFLAGTLAKVTIEPNL